MIALIWWKMALLILGGLVGLIALAWLVCFIAVGWVLSHDDDFDERFPNHNGK